MTELINVMYTLSLAVFIAGIVLVIMRLKRPDGFGRQVTPLIILAAGFALCSMLVHIPAYIGVYSGEMLCVLKSILASLHHTLRVFVLDGELDFVQGFIRKYCGGSGNGWMVFANILYIAAPVLTFGAVLSTLKRFSLVKRLTMKFTPRLYVFSELNEQALALAGSLKENHPECQIVFTDVYEDGEEESTELIEKARNLKAICFSGDITALRLSPGKSQIVYLFAIGEDESENISQALALIEKSRGWKYPSSSPEDREIRKRLFVFASGVESELLFQKSETDNLFVRRVDTVSSLVYHTIYTEGKAFFDRAIDKGDGIKEINSVIIGLGRIGTEMLKAMVWACQMDGYKLRIDAYDSDPEAEDRLAGECPELLDSAHNCAEVPGEACYSIYVHSGSDINRSGFEKEISLLPETTHVFVSLGNDSSCIKAAVKMREICMRFGRDPVIQAVTYNSDRVRYLDNICNFKKQKYEISFVGDTDSCYSESCIIDSELESRALDRHLHWIGDKADYETILRESRAFWSYEYNYRSSVASVIHHELKKHCGIPGAEKKNEGRTDEERLILAKLEHRRWNAYMRSSGYRYSGSTSALSRNDMAKLHNCLVPFEQLPEEYIDKDVF